MVSAIETLQQIEAVCPPSSFRDDLERFRKDIFMEMPDQTVGLFRRASLVFVEHFPTDEASWAPWQHRAAAMFKQAQNKWMADNNLSNDRSE